MASSSRDFIPGCKRIIVKVGTAVVTQANGRLALGRLGALVEQASGGELGEAPMAGGPEAEWSWRGKGVLTIAQLMTPVPPLLPPSAA